MTFDWQTLLALAVISLMLLGVFRGGRSEGRESPIGTARLQRDLTELRSRFATIETKVEEIRRDVDAAPTKADIAGLTEQIKGVSGHIESVDNAVVRIENILMNGAAQAVAAPAKRTRR